MFLSYLPLLPIQVAAAQPQFLLPVWLIKLEHVDQRLGGREVLLDDIVQFLVRQVNDVIVDNKVEKLFAEIKTRLLKCKT